MGLRHTQGAEKRLCSAAPLPGTTTLPFVISTEGVPEFPTSRRLPGPRVRFPLKETA
jgi:hypothetical protein